MYFLDHHKKVLPQRRKDAKKTQILLCAFASLREENNFLAVSSRNRSSSVANFASSPCNQSERSITVNRDRNSTISCSGVVGCPGTFRPIRDASTNRRTCDQTCGKMTTRHAW